MKRIVTKSLHNLNQIKNIINKKVTLYCELNDIPLDENFKNKFSGEKKEVKFNINDNNNTQVKKSKINKDKYIKSVIKEVDESNYLSAKNSKKLLITKELSLKGKEELNTNKENEESNNNTPIFNKKRNININNNISNNSETLLKNNKIIGDIILGLNQNNIKSFFEENKNISKENKSNIKSNIISGKNELFNQSNKKNTEILKLNQIILILK